MLIYRESNQKNLVSKRNSKFNVPKLNPSTLKNKPWKLNLVLGPNIRWTLFGIECETDDFSRLPIGMMYQSHHFFFFMIIWLYANLETMSRFHNSINVNRWGSIGKHWNGRVLWNYADRSTFCCGRLRWNDVKVVASIRCTNCRLEHCRSKKLIT